MGKKHRSLHFLLTVIAVVALLIMPTIAIGRSIFEQYLETQVSAKDIHH